MTEAEWDAGLPVLTTCEGCGGKCCSGMRTPPYTWTPGDEPPPEFVDEIRDAAFQSLDDRPDMSPCIWLQPDGRCREYERRPLICRELKRGGPGCRKWRGELPDDWEHPDEDELNFDDTTQPAADDELVVRYTPSAIRDHFAASPRAGAFVAAMTDDELRAAGELARDSDATWLTFHVALCAALGMDPDAAMPG